MRQSESSVKRWDRMTVEEKRAEAARRVAEQRTKQGLPEKVSDPDVLRDLAASLTR